MSYVKAKVNFVFVDMVKKEKQSKGDGINKLDGASYEITWEAFKILLPMSGSICEHYDKIPNIKTALEWEGGD